VLLGGGFGTAAERTKFGRVDASRPAGDQYDEALEVIAGLWDEGPFSYDGE
jgi:alkanesulfonate monooxygenase SsuD/methylene tetrahydromethanopterin reductase-like flavin-dependent oxidoreductase (luciferase family)